MDAPESQPLRLIRTQTFKVGRLGICRRHFYATPVSPHGHFADFGFRGRPDVRDRAAWTWLSLTNVYLIDPSHEVTFTVIESCIVVTDRPLSHAEQRMPSLSDKMKSPPTLRIGVDVGG